MCELVKITAKLENVSVIAPEVIVGSLHEEI
jgi:hypothetical protein